MTAGTSCDHEVHSINALYPVTQYASMLIARGAPGTVGAQHQHHTVNTFLARS